MVGRSFTACATTFIAAVCSSPPYGCMGRLGDVTMPPLQALIRRGVPCPCRWAMVRGGHMGTACGRIPSRPGGKNVPAPRHVRTVSSTSRRGRPLRTASHGGSHKRQKARDGCPDPLVTAVPCRRHAPHAKLTAYSECRSTSFRVAPFCRPALRFFLPCAGQEVRSPSTAFPNRHTPFPLLYSSHKSVADRPLAASF